MTRPSSLLAGLAAVGVLLVSAQMSGAVSQASVLPGATAVVGSGDAAAPSHSPPAAASPVSPPVPASSTRSTPPPSSPSSSWGAGSSAPERGAYVTADEIVAIDAPGEQSPIRVHAEIADNVQALVDAAEADGIVLGGWGWRSHQQQIGLRVEHCAKNPKDPTEWEIWEKPSSSCRPPTARPGRSNHETGRAIDFTYQGRAIPKRSSPAFRWLADNAWRFGLFNLPSEPWHWSVNGE